MHMHMHMQKHVFTPFHILLYDCMSMYQFVMLVWATHGGADTGVSCVHGECSFCIFQVM